MTYVCQGSVFHNKIGVLSRHKGRRAVSSGADVMLLRQAVAVTWSRSIVSLGHIQLLLTLFARVNCAWIMKVASEMSLERMFEVSAKVQYVLARRDLSAFADGKRDYGGMLQNDNAVRSVLRNTMKYRV